MFNSKSIQGIAVLILGLLVAIWLGLSIVTNQTETILKIIAAIGFIFCLSLGRKIWLLIPFMAALNIELRIPGQPSAILVAQILLISFSLAPFMLRKLPFSVKLTELETWMLILTLVVVQVYMRNPVGVNLFGGDTVGGKGYALYAIALLASLILAGLEVPNSDLKWYLRLSILGGIASLAVAKISAFFPTIGYYTGASYSRTDEVNYENAGKAIDTQAASRVGELTVIGKNLSLWISCYISPLRACLSPLWGTLVLLSIISALMGGFRNGIILVGLNFMIGIAYRSGTFSVIFSSITGAILIAILAVVNVIAPLPPNVQRALTFLPGTWEQRYRDDAETSTEWRVEIWKEALLSDRWIHNKLLGDGLGFSAKELAGQMNDRKGAGVGISGWDAHRETVLVNGDYHSGPVSTIRVIGYAGLLIFIVAQVRLAVHAHRQIIRYRRTEWFPLTLLVGIPLIAAPFFFVFVFGDFKADASKFLISCGLLRLMRKNLPNPAYHIK